MTSLARRKLLPGALQHRGGKIRGDDRHSLVGPASQQRESHVAGAAADVEDARFGPHQNMQKTARRAPPPDAIHVAGEHVIQQVVARRDAVEHFADGAGRTGFVLRAGGPRSGGVG